MTDSWLLTPYFFEQSEPALAKAVPDGTRRNDVGDLPDRTPETLTRVHRPIAEFMKATLSAGQRPISVAGDCCASIPALAGVQAAGIQPTLVWIDAHGDFNTPETSPSQFLGGMPLAMMVGRGPQWMCDAVGLTTLPEDRIWLVDGRDLDPLERAAVDASALRRTGMAGLGSLKIEGPVHVHCDMDVMDAAEVPGFQYPVEGGPSVADTISACQAFATANEIVSISISGWTDSLDPTGRTAEASRDVALALATR